MKKMKIRKCLSLVEILTFFEIKAFQINTDNLMVYVKFISNFKDS